MRLRESEPLESGSEAEDNEENALLKLRMQFQQQHQPHILQSEMDDGPERPSEEPVDEADQDVNPHIADNPLQKEFLQSMGFFKLCLGAIIFLSLFLSNALLIIV